MRKSVCGHMCAHRMCERVREREKKESESTSDTHGCRRSYFIEIQLVIFTKECMQKKRQIEFIMSIVQSIIFQ